MKKTYILIGRFQPWHLGHHEIAKHALSKADRLVIFVGSVNKAPDFKNPFSFEERKDFILKSLTSLQEEYLSQKKYKEIIILPINDYIYNNNKWLSEIYSSLINHGIDGSIDEIYLTGFPKDKTSDYLEYFPSWKKDFFKEKINNIDSEKIRKEYFEGDYHLKKKEDFNFPVTNAVNDYLYAFSHLKKSEKYLLLKDEFNFVKKYKKQYENFPYKVPFLTGDAVVVCSGHILLIKRRNLPGKGLYALPGGFVDYDKDYDQVETAVRELYEETKIKVPVAVVRGSIKKKIDFSDPFRSLRGRIFTKAVLIQLNDKDLPKVSSSNETTKSFWLPIGEIEKNKDKFFEDHYHIINTVIGL